MNKEYMLANYSHRPEELIKYAENIIEGRWKEAEPFIMQNPDSIYFYAAKVLKKRWRKAESFLLQPIAEPYYILRYIEILIKKRWKKAETFLKKDPSVWETYCAMFNIRRKI